MTAGSVCAFSLRNTVYDSWDIAIYYNRKSYKINYYTDNAYVKELINLLIDISPVHVDLHGWS